MVDVVEEGRRAGLPLTTLFVCGSEVARALGPGRLWGVGREVALSASLAGWQMMRQRQAAPFCGMGDGAVLSGC